MKNILSIIGGLLILFVYSIVFGYGWFLIYEFGVKYILQPIYQLPDIGPISFAIITVLFSVFNSSAVKNDENRKTYEMSDTEGYQILLSKIFTLYAHAIIVLILYGMSATF